MVTGVLTFMVLSTDDGESTAGQCLTLANAVHWKDPQRDAYEMKLQLTRKYSDTSDLYTKYVESYF